MIAVLVMLLGAHAAPEPTPVAHSTAEVRAAATSPAAILATVRDLNPSLRAEVTASTRRLIADCPYTRVALVLPLVLHAAADQLDVASLDPRVRDDWWQVRAGLAEHVAVVTLLGVEEEGASLRDVAAEIASLPERASRVDGRTLAEIERISARLEAITGVARPCPRGPWAVLPGQPWTMGMQLAELHDALRRMEPLASGASRAQLRAMIDVLDAYGAASLA